MDPTLMFKALFIGYLFGIRSERQLVREIEVNVAYRWFLRLKLTDKVFDASTLSQNRRRRYNDASVAQDIFDHIVEQAIAHGLVDGTVLYTDSTHLKANANKGKYDLAQIEKSRADYWADLDRAVEAERRLHGQKPLKEQERSPEVKQTKVSRTDPDSGYMVREGKPKGFFYLDHRTVDGKLGIVTDTFTTPANVHDSIVYLNRLDRQAHRFSFQVKAVGLDAGYATSAIARGLEERDILGGDRIPPPVCPKARHDAQIKLRLRGANRWLPLSRRPAADLCNDGQERLQTLPLRPCHLQKKCPLLASCTSNARAERTITRHVWQESRERSDTYRLTPWGKAVYKRRKETVERSFADAKQLHGHRYARFRSLVRVQMQCLLAAAAQNIKKIAMALTKPPKQVRA
ncbi:IS1182 family transposase [Roseibium salinum]|nr:IS1182 family transposase [Roseibium salinum]